MQSKHIAIIVALCAAFTCSMVLIFVFADTVRNLKAISDAPELTAENAYEFFEGAGRNDSAVIRATLTSVEPFQGLSGENCVWLEIREQKKGGFGWRTKNLRVYDTSRALVLGLDVTHLLGQLQEQRISYYVNPDVERHVYKYIPDELPVTLYCRPARDDLGFNARLSAGDISALKASVVIDALKYVFIALICGIFVYLISMGWYRMLTEREELLEEDEYVEDEESAPPPRIALK